MPIPEKLDNEKCIVTVELSSDTNKIVKEKRDKIRGSGLTCSKEKAINEIIKEWNQFKSK